MTLPELERVAEEYSLQLTNDVAFEVPENEDDHIAYVKSKLIEVLDSKIRERGYFLIGKASFTLQELDRYGLWIEVRELIWLAVEPQDDYQYYGQIKDWFDSRIETMPSKLYLLLRRLYRFFEYRCVFYRDGAFCHGIQTQYHFDSFLKLCDCLVDIYLFDKGLRIGEAVANHILGGVRTGKIDPQVAYVHVLDVIFDCDQKIRIGERMGKKIGLDLTEFVECVRPLEAYLKSRPAPPAVEVVERLGNDKLSHAQIALFYIYSGQAITKNNAQNIAKRYGQTSGPKLHAKYNLLLSSITERTSPKNAAKNIEIVLKMLTEPGQIKRANDELVKANEKLNY